MWLTGVGEVGWGRGVTVKPGTREPEPAGRSQGQSRPLSDPWTGAPDKVMVRVDQGWRIQGSST